MHLELRPHVKPFIWPTADGLAERRGIPANDGCCEPIQPGDIFGNLRILCELTKALAARALNTMLDGHPGHLLWQVAIETSTQMRDTIGA